MLIHSQHADRSPLDESQLPAFSNIKINSLASESTGRQQIERRLDTDKVQDEDRHPGACGIPAGSPCILRAYIPRASPPPASGQPDCSNECSCSRIYLRPTLPTTEDIPRRVHLSGKRSAGTFHLVSDPSSFHRYSARKRRD